MYYTEWNNIPVERYNAILADPPWPYKDVMRGHSFSLDHEYVTQPLRWITNLPVRDISSKNSLCFLWVPSPQLVDGLSVLKAWGFKYKTIAFVWSKHTKHLKKVHNLGRWTMGNVELVLLGTRGKPQRLAKNIKQLIEAERTAHSRKPDETRRRIEQLIEGPRIELFARGANDQWDQFGNEPDWSASEGPAVEVEVPDVPVVGT